MVTPSLARSLTTQYGDSLTGLGRQLAGEEAVQGTRGVALLQMPEHKLPNGELRAVFAAALFLEDYVRVCACACACA